MSPRIIFAKAVENWPAKVLSIGMAIILFVFYRMSALETRYFSVPLQVEQLSGMMPSAQYPRMIRVGLRGESNSIYSVLEDEIEAFVDMSGFHSRGTYTAPVQWRKRGMAQGLEALQVTVDPIEISFSLDYRISRFVPVTASFRGQVYSGHSMTSYSLNPNQIIVDGPAGIMAEISELPTNLIDLDGRRGDFSGTVDIVSSNPLIIIQGNSVTDYYCQISRIVPGEVP